MRTITSRTISTIPIATTTVSSEYMICDGTLPAFQGVVMDNRSVSPQNRWWRVTTGDTDGDGRDEVVLATYPTTAGSMRDTKSYIKIIHFTDPASGSRAYTESPSIEVKGGFVNGLIVADIQNDGLPEIVVSTSVGLDLEDRSCTYWYKGQSPYTKLGEHISSGRGFDLATGNVDADSTREVILAASPRSESHDVNSYKSLKIWKAFGGEPRSDDRYWIFSWPGWGWGYYYGLGAIVASDKTDNVSGYYSYSPPYWRFIATGDLNGSGDQEIVTIRNTDRWSGSINHLRIQDPYWPSGYADLNKTYETAIYDGIVTGDFYGVGRDYIALMSPSLPGVYIYDLGNRPKGGLGVDDGGRVTAKASYRVTYFGGERAKVMAVGDFDGSRMQTSQSNVGFMVLSGDGSAPFGLQQSISVGCNVPGVTPTIRDGEFAGRLVDDHGGSGTMRGPSGSPRRWIRSGRGRTIPTTRARIARRSRSPVPVPGYPHCAVIRRKSVWRSPSCPRVPDHAAVVDKNN